MQSNQQVCETFDDVNYFGGDSPEPEMTLFTCMLKAELTDKNENTGVDTTRNPSYNYLVRAVQLIGSGLNIYFIPSSIFEIFSKLEYFTVSGEQGLVLLQPEFFTGAKSLMYLLITETAVEELPGNLFAEAPNLEVIDLQRNKIGTIDKLAFSNLLSLRELNLDNNEIMNLYPTTFSHLSNLEILSLLDCMCINKVFELTGDFTEVENEIKDSCEFDAEPKVTAVIIEVITDQQENTDPIHEVVIPATNENKTMEALSVLEEKYKELLEKFKTFTEKLEKSESSLKDENMALTNKVTNLTVEIDFLKTKSYDQNITRLEQNLEEAIESLKENDSRFAKIETKFNELMPNPKLLTNDPVPDDENKNCCIKNISVFDDYRVFKKSASAQIKTLQISTNKVTTDIKYLKSEGGKLSIKAGSIETRLSAIEKN